MRRWRNNYFIVLLCAIFSASCGFADLRSIGVGVEPDKTDSLLPEPYSPVILKFDTEMVKEDAEGILQISSEAGMVMGDRFWNGNDLYFVPAAGWTAGIRYTLILSGTIRSVDKRELRIERYVSFYAINKSTPPFLVCHSPADGESVGTGNVVLEFQFSCPMDRFSVESALTIDVIGNKTFEWSDDDTILKVIPEKKLSPWIPCRWNLRESAKNLDGVPLSKAASGHFITNQDKVIPKVKKVFPVLNSEGRWFPTGMDIETGLGQGQGIAVEFNKTMDENVLRSLRIEPSLTGRTEFLSENSVVYIFTKDPEPDTIFTLIVSGNARDSEGLTIGSDFRINFVPDIPLLNLVSIKVDGYPVTEIYSNTDNVSSVPVDPAIGELYFTVYFSLMFNEEEKRNTVYKISLSPFFPKTIPPVALQYVRWISDDRLRMGWDGLTAGSSDESHYYKLVIPGGKHGITSGGGIYMKEDITLYLKAVK